MKVTLNEKKTEYVLAALMKMNETKFYPLRAVKIRSTTGKPPLGK